MTALTLSAAPAQRPTIDVDAPHIVAAAVAHLEARNVRPIVTREARQRLWAAGGHYTRLSMRLNEQEAGW